jgi:hypothetical protein
MPLDDEETIYEEVPLDEKRFDELMKTLKARWAVRKDIEECNLNKNKNGIGVRTRE